MRNLTIPVLAFLLLGGCRKAPEPSAGQRSLPALPHAKAIQGLSDPAREELLYGWLLHRIEAEDSLFDQDREIAVRLPAGYLDLYATRLVEEHLEEGGIGQLMGSVDRRFLPDAVRAYRRFGALGHARLLQRAQRKLDRNQGVVQWEETKELAELPEDTLYQALDRRLAALREDVPRLRGLWIRHHLNRFVLR